MTDDPRPTSIDPDMSREYYAALKDSNLAVFNQLSNSATHSDGVAADI